MTRCPSPWGTRGAGSAAEAGIPSGGGEEGVVLAGVSAPPGPRTAPGRSEGGARAPPRAGEPVGSGVNAPAGGEGHGVRVFAGARWDPFIMDAPAALKTIATGKLAFTDPSSIFLDGKDVLSLVVELDTALLGGAEVLAVVAETLTRGVFNV